MTTLLIIFIIILLIGVIVAPILFMQFRKNHREQKNIERGLKMVPMLIHLPPPSDDTEVGSRDVRDVTDETISRATIIYDIIASTFQKSFKRSYFGQRHLAFEIIGTQGFVSYYASVPVTLVEVIKQAINSAYPTARLEEVAEHNIFSPVGKISGSVGGELELKEHYAYPIATYQDLKRDTMQSLLNALSTIGKEDGVGVQILLRPAHPSWRKTATDLADKKRKGDKGLAVGSFAKDVAVAFAKPPEGDKGGESSKPDLSHLDQTTLDAIDEKTRHAGFETAIRVVVSSNINQRAVAILNNIVASFNLYDAPGRNGFKYEPAKDIEDLVTSYIMRYFPQHKNSTILNSVELASLFHFPDERDIPTSQLSRQASKQVDGPRNIPEEGLLLGYNLFRGAKKPIRLSLNDRQRHMYVVGQTGTGKSTFLENLALQDMLNGNGFAFVDPHGDVVERLMAMVPKERTEDIIYFSPADMDHPMGLNLFEFQHEDQKDFLIQEALNMLQKLYDPQHQGIMGPRYEHIFRNAAQAIMADPEGGTFVDIPKLFRDPAFLKQKLQHVKDPNVLDFWQKEYPASQRSNDAGEINSWFVSKFGAFLSNEMMRNVIGQTKSAFDLRDIMDNKKILLVNLSKGRTGDLNSKLLGMVFVMKFQAAAMSRSDIPEDERIDFSLYVDEFQNFSTDSFATIMSEARKYHLNLIVANQFTTQLTQEIRDAVFGNMGTIISFRIGQNDVESLGKYFHPTFDSDDLLRVPNHNTIVRTLIGGIPTQPFSMVTLPPLGTPRPRLAIALKQLSAAKYGKPRSVVEADILKRMATKTLPSGTPTGAYRAPGAAQTLPATNANARAAQPKPANSASFLDDWLNKRQGFGTAQAPRTVAARPMSQPTKPLPSQPPVSVSTVPKQAQAVQQPALPKSSTKAAASSAPVKKEQKAPEKTVTAEQTNGEKPPKENAPQNISSNELEKNEIQEIAAELKEELNESENTEKGKTEVHPSEGDTILIDQDGTFHIAEE
ncbi:MAG: helicase HerA domain-containing protein [Candidatus Saccharimonadales bacterium]